MSHGRESRSAAAAVAAWPLGLLALAILSKMPHGALSRGLPLPPLPPPPQLTCNSVPYPFGSRGKSLRGFEVTCGPNKEAMLRIGEHSYRIDEVSVPGGSVTIFAGPIRQVCYDRNGRPTPTTGTGDMNLVGTPFSFSERNKLLVTGCNFTLVATFATFQTSSCSSWCNGSSNAIAYGPCLGVACCEAHVPMGGAQDFSIFEFQRTSGHITGDEAGTCSAALFLNQREQAFMVGRDSGKMPLKDALLPASDRRMVLDWAIGRGTCDQAMSYHFGDPYCNNMSSCIDAPSGAGYLCKCKAGFDGNPYAADGCADINECRNVESNNCSILQFCNNTQGGYTCSCPQNMNGDGYRTGTNCTDALKLSGSPTQQPQGMINTVFAHQSHKTTTPLVLLMIYGNLLDFNVCTHPENPCMYSKYCSDGQGDVSCGCPPGMGGDGRKKGSGCQKHFPIVTALGNLLNTPGIPN